MFTIDHIICGGPAMLYTEDPIKGTPVIREKCRRLNGTEYKEGDKPICGTCRMDLRIEHCRPGLNSYDMGSTEDMEMLYGRYPDYID